MHCSSILADTPSFSFEPAGPGSDFETLLVHAKLAVFGRVKIREGTTDDLFCSVTLQPFSSRVPSEYTPVDTEKVNRDNALDK